MLGVLPPPMGNPPTSIPREGRAAPAEAEHACSPESTPHPVLLPLVPLAKAVAALLGPMCEVVVHDLSDPDNLERTIIALEGAVTGRQIGGPPTDYLLERLRRQDDLAAGPPFAVYPGRTAAGRPLKCCTTFVQEADRVVGAFCINLDVSQWEAARDLIERLCRVEVAPGHEAPVENFTADVRSTIAAMLREALATVGKPAPALSKEERIAVVGELDRRGAFLVRGVVGQIARALGVSRYTLYNYLDAARARTPDLLE